MNNTRNFLSLICLLMGFLTQQHSCVFAEEQPDSNNTGNEHALRIYVDCDQCDFDYLRKNISFVHYVRDRTEAQVHILATTRQSGSGGNQYTFTFLGQKEYDGTNDTLQYSSKKTETEDERRKGIVQTLKLGLIRYAARTPLADKLSISYTAPEQKTELADPWDNWVFNINTDCSLNGEQSNKSTFLYGSISANRVTEQLKVNLSVYGNYNENNYDYQDFSYLSVSRSKGMSGLAALSVSDHTSLGMFISSSTSTYSNIKLSFSLAPAAEYNIFPYSESTRRQLRLTYKPKLTRYVYEQETIYDKTNEWLFSENLTVSLDQKEPWGSSSISVHASHYFHDFNKYNIGISGSLSVRVFEGLSVNVYGDYTKPHDQIALVKGEASQQEVLLQRRELETQYRYYISVGLGYTFGSIFNNIVNPRFGE